MTAKLYLTMSKRLRLQGVDESIVIPESLSLEIHSLIYGTDEMIVEIRNGRKTEKRKVNGAQPIDLSAFLYAGKIEMNVSLVARGQIVKKWSVVPMVIYETDGGFDAFDEINDLSNRVAALEEKTKIVL